MIVIIALIPVFSALILGVCFGLLAWSCRKTRLTSKMDRHIFVGGVIASSVFALFIVFYISFMTLLVLR